MNTKSKIFFIGVLSAFLWSCDKESDSDRPDFIPVDDAKAVISSMNDGLKSDLEDMSDTKGGKAMEDFSTLLDQEGEGFRVLRNTAIAKVEATMKDIEKALTPKLSFDVEPEQKGFDFEGSAGVYVWNFEQQTFVMTDEVIDHIQIQYPTRDSETNNAVFKLLEFTLKELDGEVVPSKILAQLFVDDQLEVSFDLELNYSFIGFLESAHIDLLVAPFELNVDFALSTQSISFSSSLSRDEKEILSFGLKGEFAGTGVEELSGLEITFSYGDVVKMIGNIDIEGLNNASETAVISDFVDIKIYSNEFGVYDDSTLLGTVVFKPTTSGDVEVYIEYTDGSTELLSDVLSTLFGEMEVGV